MFNSLMTNLIADDKAMTDLESTNVPALNAIAQLPCTIVQFISFQL